MHAPKLSPPFQTILHAVRSLWVCINVSLSYSTHYMSIQQEKLQPNLMGAECTWRSTDDTALLERSRFQRQKESTSVRHNLILFPGSIQSTSTHAPPSQELPSAQPPKRGFRKTSPWTSFQPVSCSHICQRIPPFSAQAAGSSAASSAVASSLYLVISPGQTWGGIHGK